MSCAICHLLGQFEFQKHHYTVLVCAPFGPHAAIFVNRVYPGKSLKWSFVSPGKPIIWSLQVLDSPDKHYFTVCTNPGRDRRRRASAN